ncbi:MAG: helix-turn-helix transcriptional regulator [Clostridia bacterium]|nr:helix-turn-helix transcriptional regulator [Clostridia bacterium]
MSKSDLISIGKRIQTRRKQMGYTQEQLSELMNVSIQMISNLERGNKAIRIDNLIKLCQILNVSCDYILTGQEALKDIEILSEKFLKLAVKDKKMIELLIDYCSKKDE